MRTSHKLIAAGFAALLAGGAAFADEEAKAHEEAKQAEAAEQQDAAAERAAARERMRAERMEQIRDVSPEMRQRMMDRRAAGEAMRERGEWNRERGTGLRDELRPVERPVEGGPAMPNEVRVHEFSYPREATGAFNRAVLLLDRGEYDLARELFQQAIESHEEFPEAHHNLALMLRASAEEEAQAAALAHATRAIELAPAMPETYLTRSIILADAGEKDLAAADLEALAELQPAEFAKALAQLHEQHAREPLAFSETLRFRSQFITAGREGMTNTQAFFSNRQSMRGAIRESGAAERRPARIQPEERLVDPVSR